MKCYGPKSWCEFIDARVGTTVGDDTIVISLNPTRQLPAHIRHLEEAVQSGKTVLVYSLTTRKDLERDPRLAELLKQTTFIQGPNGSVVDHILHVQPRQ